MRGAITDLVTISDQDLAAAASAGHAQLIDAELDHYLKLMAGLSGEAAAIAFLAMLGLEPPDGEAQLADIGRRRDSATARLAAVRDALRTPAGSHSSAGPRCRRTRTWALPSTRRATCRS